ncbi:hypothetical protein [Maribacter luteus]|uniref:hypothetical protein n=1 Tax=Maribacter luteus TaxID=2594478 RepID=UPI0024913332|nr:hypothetical protein [Maribacter luteus]
MEIEKKQIFQIDDPAVKKVYREADNYKVKFHTGPDVEQDLCVLYFSSNELYYPNTAKAFENSILIKDKFEWQRNFLRRAHKHIFIRDIQKQWYIEGISEKANSPEKLLNLLKQLTKGFRVYAMGSSAGGFAALLYGSLLQADRVYAFNAQLNLNLVVEGSTPFVDPILFKYKDQERSKYFIIENFLDQERDCFYFQSSKSVIDIKQYNALKNKNLLIRILFKTSNHGFPFLRHNLMYVLGLSKGELLDLASKTYHPIVFAASIEGWLKTIRVVVMAVVNRLKKKLKQKIDFL